MLNGRNKLVINVENNVEINTGELKGKESFESQVQNNLFTFKVYNTPDAVIKNVIAISRVHFGNSVPAFLDWSIEQFKIQSKDAFTVEDLMPIIQDIQELQKRVNFLESKIQTVVSEKNVEKSIKTLGGNVNG